MQQCMYITENAKLIAENAKIVTGVLGVWDSSVGTQHKKNNLFLVKGGTALEEREVAEETSIRCLAEGYSGNCLLNMHN